MAYPSVNFQLTTLIGGQVISVAESTQNHVPGTRAKAVDVTYGEAEFIYLKGVASTAAGDLVFFDTKSFTTVRGVHGGAGSSGPAAVAMSACTAGKYGWYAVGGSVPINAATVAANSAVYLTSTAGQVDDALVAGDRVDGIYLKSADSGGFATVQISSPCLSDESIFAGNLTGNVTGNVTGNLTGNVTGNVTGNLTGSVVGKLFPAVGTYASRPAAGTAGAVYIATDAPVSMWVDSGSAWHPMLGGQVYGTQPKAAATFTAVNQGSTTLTDVNGALAFHMPAASGSTQTRCYVEALASTTLHVEGAFQTTYLKDTSGFPSLGGIIMRDSATGNAFTFGIVSDQTDSYAPATPFIFMDYGVWASTSSRSSTLNLKWPINAKVIIMRIRRDASNVYAEISADNTVWFTLATVSMATAFGAGAPTHVGIVGISWSNIEAYDFLVTHYNSGT